jgi:hypothetical protein
MFTFYEIETNKRNKNKKKKIFTWIFMVAKFMVGKPHTSEKEQLLMHQKYG